MANWSEHFLTSTLDEVTLSQVENQQWYKELQRKTNALMDSKLAKQIGPEEYATNRKAANDEMAECRRRRAILANEIFNRKRPVRVAAVYE